MSLPKVPRLPKVAKIDIDQVKSWFVAPAPDAPLPTDEGTASFRIMGLSHQATYGDIQRAYVTLSQKYKKDKKRSIKIKNAKDELLQMRLKQRYESQVGTLGAVTAEEVDDMRDTTVTDVEDEEKKASEAKDTSKFFLIF